MVAGGESTTFVIFVIFLRSPSFFALKLFLSSVVRRCHRHGAVVIRRYQADA